jgi:hypothetical protein
MSIYKKDRAGEDKPDAAPIREYQNYGLQSVATKQSVTVEYQSAFDVLPVARKILSPKDASREVFKDLLVEEGWVPNRQVTLLKLYDHKIDRAFSEYDRIYSTDQSVFVVPSPLLQDAPGKKIIRVGHAVHESYLRMILRPFFVRVETSEKVADFLVRLKDLLQCSEAEYAVLKTGVTMGEAIAAVPINGDVYLFVIHPGDKKTSAYSHDPSLKIYN